MQVECLDNGKENGKGYFFLFYLGLLVYFCLWFVLVLGCIYVSEDVCVRMTYTDSLRPASRSWI